MQAAHFAVGPLAVFNGTLSEAAGLIGESIRTGRGLRVATANLDFAARARHDRQLRADLAASHLVVADGAPVAWLARAAGAVGCARVSGVDLVTAIFEGQRGHAGELRVASYGSTPEVVARAAAAIEGQYPGVRFTARVCPPFRALTDEERAADAQTLAKSGADVVLVALGCPRQERFIAEHFHLLPDATWIGVGGTFDFFAGLRRRAPGRVQRAGGEWLVRLAQDPKRLWRRYLVDDLPTLFVLAAGVALGRVRGRSGGSGTATDLRSALLAVSEGTPAATP